jgi:hypothetical protein
LIGRRAMTGRASEVLAFMREGGRNGAVASGMKLE